MHCKYTDNFQSDTLRAIFLKKERCKYTPLTKIQHNFTVFRILMMHKKRKCQKRLHHYSTS